MIAFPGMLVPAAQVAGISLPPDPDAYLTCGDDFPHWHVFCAAQIGHSMPYAGCHWDNAKVVASIPLEEIKTVTMGELIEKGFAVSFN